MFAALKNINRENSTSTEIMKIYRIQLYINVRKDIHQNLNKKTAPKIVAV